MNPEQIPNEIFDWLLTTEYDDLSEDQKASVQKHMSESEYRTQYATGKIATRSMQSLASLSNRDELLGQITNAKKQPQSGVIRFLRAPVPLWKAVASIAILIALFQLGKHTSTGESSGFVSVTDTIFVTIRDTITLVQRDTVVKEIVREKVRYAENRPQHSPTPNMLPTQRETGSRNTLVQSDFHVLHPDQIDRHRFTGRSAANDNALKEIGFVGM